MTKIPHSVIAGMDEAGVGDTEGGPKGDILGQAGAGIGTEYCLEFPAWVRAEWVRCETNSRIKTTSIYAF